MNNSSVGSILIHAPVMVRPDVMIFEAIETLKKFQISSVAVVDESFKAIGIFTEHDALRIIAEEIDQSGSITTVMSYDPISLEENINFNDAYTIMSENHYRHLIITDSLGKCIGVVTEGDMIRHIGLQYLGKLKKVSEAMNDSPLIFELGTTLKFAAAEMKKKKTDYGVCQATFKNDHLRQIKMPKKSGIDMSREIRKINKSIPIIVMTSYPEQEDMIESVRLGLSDFLLKPVNYSDFKRVLEQILDKLVDNKMMSIEIGKNYIYDYRSKTIIKNDTEIALTEREIKLFEYFLQNENKLITRSQIEDIAYNGEWMSDSAFKNLMLKLRKKLPVNCMKAIKNLGYIFILNDLHD